MGFQIKDFEGNDLFPKVKTTDLIDNSGNPFIPASVSQLNGKQDTITSSNKLSYNLISDKPTINNVEVAGNKSSADLGLLHTTDQTPSSDIEMTEFLKNATLSDDGNTLTITKSDGSNVVFAKDKPYELIEKIIVGYSITTSQPADWLTNYNDYFTSSGEGVDLIYVQNAFDEAPAWQSGTYYKLAEDETINSVRFNLNGHKPRDICISATFPAKEGRSNQMLRLDMNGRPSDGGSGIIELGTYTITSSGGSYFFQLEACNTILLGTRGSSNKPQVQFGNANKIWSNVAYYNAPINVHYFENIKFSTYGAGSKIPNNSVFYLYGKEV